MTTSLVPLHSTQILTLVQAFGPNKKALCLSTEGSSPNRVLDYCYSVNVNEQVADEVEPPVVRRMPNPMPPLTMIGA